MRLPINGLTTESIRTHTTRDHSLFSPLAHTNISIVRPIETERQTIGGGGGPVCVERDRGKRHDTIPYPNQQSIIHPFRVESRKYYVSFRLRNELQRQVLVYFYPSAVGLPNHLWHTAFSTVLRLSHKHRHCFCGRSVLYITFSHQRHCSLVHQTVKWMA